MGGPSQPRVLLVVEPALLGLLLTQILQTVGEDEVIDLSGRPVPSPARPFSVAVVSKPLAEEAMAEVVIVLPEAASTEGHVSTVTGRLPVQISGPLDLLDVLDRFWPTGRSRAEVASGWAPGGHPPTAGPPGPPRRWPRPQDRQVIGSGA